MARRVVAIEGCPMGDSRCIDHRALSPNGTFIPVMVEWVTVGGATDFQRDEDGNISFEIELDSDFDERDFRDWFYHITVNQCLWDQADDTALLVSGVIISLYLDPKPTPWDVINHGIIR